MATRTRSTKRRKGVTPHRVRDSSSKFKSMANYKRAVAAERRHVSAAKVGARLDAVEKQVLRATNNAVKVARNSMREAVAAARVVRGSMKQAVAAVRRATKRVARRVSAAGRALKSTAKTAKRPARTSGRRLSA
jgi:hypothetical protein